MAERIGGVESAHRGSISGINLRAELSSSTQMLIQGETIDFICHIKESNHLAMASRQGPVQIFSYEPSTFRHYQPVTLLDEDHARLLTGICEITKVKDILAHTNPVIEPQGPEPQLLAVDQTREEPTESQLVTCGLDGLIAIYDIVKITVQL